jgi:Lipocalin-like domain
MADEAAAVTGVWILRSAYVELVDKKEKALPFGDDPRGVLILDEGGRMAAIITPSLHPGDAPPPPRKFAAYSGRYRIEPGGRFVTDVDIAWLPTWLGTQQGRNFSISNGKLHIATDPAPFEWLDGAVGVGVVIFAREDRAAQVVG